MTFRQRCKGTFVKGSPPRNSRIACFTNLSRRDATARRPSGTTAMVTPTPQSDLVFLWRSNHCFHAVDQQHGFAAGPDNFKRTLQPGRCQNNRAILLGASIVKRFSQDCRCRHRASSRVGGCRSRRPTPRGVVGSGLDMHQRNYEKASRLAFETLNQINVLYEVVNPLQRHCLQELAGAQPGDRRAVTTGHSFSAAVPGRSCGSISNFDDNCTRPNVDCVRPIEVLQFSNCLDISAGGSRDVASDMFCSRERFCPCVCQCPGVRRYALRLQTHNSNTAFKCRHRKMVR